MSLDLGTLTLHTGSSPAQKYELILGQTNWEVKSFWVACIPECESPWRESNTMRRRKWSQRSLCAMGSVAIERVRRVDQWLSMYMMNV